MNNGWSNSATEGFALVVFNDRKMSQSIDYAIHNNIRRIRHPARYVAQVNREDWWNGDVNWWEILCHRAHELHRSGELRPGRWERINTLLKEMCIPTFEGAIAPSKSEQKSSTPNPKKEDTFMLKIEQLNLVNGLDVTKMKLDDRLAIISATNKRIEELTSVMKDVASDGC